MHGYWEGASYCSGDAEGPVERGPHRVIGAGHLRIPLVDTSRAAASGKGSGQPGRLRSSSCWVNGKLGDVRGSRSLRRRPVVTQRNAPVVPREVSGPAGALGEAGHQPTRVGNLHAVAESAARSRATSAATP